MSFMERFAVKIGSYLVPPRLAYRLVRGVFATQGISWAGPADGLAGSGEARFLREYLAGIVNPVVFDVGANVGDYALAALGSKTGVTVHCFEPSAAHIEHLRRKLGANSACVLNNFGLSDKAQSLVLHKDKEITGLASLNQRNLSHLGISLNISEDVSLKSGDEYIAQNGIAHIDLLKIDTEGWEISVLGGFKEAFAARRIACCQFEFGHAQIERRENFRDFWNFFRERGFTLAALKPNGRLNQMPVYDEIYENYYATNYVATLAL